jgi:hypothetical protein
MGEIQPIRQPEEPWVDAKVVAQHLGVKPNHVCKMARAGRIPFRNMGMGKKRYLRFRISAVEAAFGEAVAS